MTDRSGAVVRDRDFFARPDTAADREAIGCCSVFLTALLWGTLLVGGGYLLVFDGAAGASSLQQDGQVGGVAGVAVDQATINDYTSSSYEAEEPMTTSRTGLVMGSRPNSRVGSSASLPRYSDRPRLFGRYADYRPWYDPFGYHVFPSPPATTASSGYDSYSSHPPHTKIDQSEHRSVVLGLMFFAYFLYAVHALCCSTTADYVKNVFNRTQFETYLQQLKSAQPRIHWDITCWHTEVYYETHTYTDAQGRTRQRRERREQRVVTHRADLDFPIASSQDLTFTYDQKVQARRRALALRREMEAAGAAVAGSGVSEVAAGSASGAAASSRTDTARGRGPPRDNIEHDRQQSDSSRSAAAVVATPAGQDSNGSNSNGNDNSDLEVCVICMDRPALSKFLPCGHQIVCADCGSEWLSRKSTCPICRGEVEMCVDAQTYVRVLIQMESEAGSGGGGPGEMNDRGQAGEEEATTYHPGIANRLGPSFSVTGGGGWLFGRGGRLEDEGADFILVEFPLDFKPRTAAAEQNYRRTKEEFYRMNRFDRHQDRSETQTLGLGCFRKHVTFCPGAEAGGRASAGNPWLSRQKYWLWTAFGFALCYRRRLLNRGRKENWWVTKRFT
eukprot:g7363.t1